jgi:hypothetical protein
MKQDAAIGLELIEQPMDDFSSLVVWSSHFIQGTLFAAVKQSSEGPYAAAYSMSLCKYLVNSPFAAMA